MRFLSSFRCAIVRALVAVLALLATGWTNDAHAQATILVPDDQPTVEAAVAAAAGGDTIVLQPGLHVIESQIVVNKNLTITAENPPREIDDVDIVADSILYLNVEAVSFIPDYDGAFLVRPNRVLNFENIRFKQYESVCGDEKDNDGNGLTDDEDPACAGDTDTALVLPFTQFTTQVRAFKVNRDATLNIRNSELQGWSWAIEGNVIRAENANSVLVENSRFINNLGGPLVTPNGDYIFGEGTIWSRGARVELYNSRFEANEQRYGGVLFATDGSQVIADDNAFLTNLAEDGGAFFIESSILSASRNFFVENQSILVPSARLFTTYEGGAIYAEDSAIDLTNNVFLRNGSLDWAAAILLRRSLDPNDPPQLINNTFVDNVPGLLGGASVMIDDTRIDYVNNISFGEGSGALGAQNWNLGSVPNVRYNDFYVPGQTFPEIPVFAGEFAALLPDSSTNIFENPEFIFYERQDHPDFRLWKFWLDPLSPAVDAGDPAITDVGGSRSDIGAYGGAQSGIDDVDGDGWPNIYDCDDEDPNIRPYQLELCDGLDNDCNGVVDDRERTWYVDRDFDGYGDIDTPGIGVCPEDELPPLAQGVYVEASGDCDDTNTLVNPGRTEFCDDIDNDCDGDRDENIVVRNHYVDLDLDGFGDPDPRLVISVACPPEGFSPFPTDCNDNNPDVHPLITSQSRTHLPLATAPLERNEADRDPDFVGDGIDQDCDTVDLCYVDLDRDGFGAAPEPGREPAYVEDNDLNCLNLSGFTAINTSDCDDGDPGTNPEGTEIVGDGLDQNCDGSELCWQDLDDDGFGSDDTFVDNDLDCDNASAATASRTNDCNDNAQGGAAINPNAEEICDGQDNDCNGQIDEVTSPSASRFFLDADGDGYGDTTQSLTACGNPLGYTKVAGDCDDNEPRAFPGNQEVCDGIDNNCEVGIDEDSALDVVRWHQDLDGDLYGNRDLSRSSCTQPDGGNWVKAGERPLDCDDSDPNIGPCASCGCSSTSPAGSLPFLTLLAAFGLIRRRKDAAA